MAEITVELDSADAEFAEDHDLDLDALLADAIDEERQQHQYENPEPYVPIEVLGSIATVHEQIVEGDETGLGTAQTPYLESRVAVTVKRDRAEDTYRVQVSLSRIEDLPGVTIRETLSNSGPFAKGVAAVLQGHLARLNDTDPSNFTFERVEHEQPEHHHDSALFEVEVSPT